MCCDLCINCYTFMCSGFSFINIVQTFINTVIFFIYNVRSFIKYVQNAVMIKVKDFYNIIFQESNAVGDKPTALLFKE